MYATISETAKLLGYKTRATIYRLMSQGHLDDYLWELIETREIKYGNDDHFERNLDYCRNFSERAVLHKGDEWNLKNIVKYCYWCMDKLNKMTREVKNEEFNINKWISERR